ncbi:MAG: aminoglycoside phosphotransferase family protein [Vicinamibacterales bacterium]
MTSPQLPDREQRVHAYLRERSLDSQLLRLDPLTPDASSRRYFRVTLTDGSIVLAVYPGAIEYASMPFSAVGALFQRMSLPSPRVLGHSDTLGVVALEDLGDVTLQNHLEHSSLADRARRYREAVELIVRIQEQGREHAAEGQVCYQLAFDVEKLTWELEFFREHFLEAYRGARLTAGEHDALATEWHGIAADLAAEPRVLCHRDFHSRNLMVHRGTLHVIDFQDARMGPDTYDLVSLLRDSYVDVTPAERASLVAHFLQRAPATDARTFPQRFDLMSVQRNLKALGTFGHQATVGKNQTYVPYMSRTLAYVRVPLWQDDRFAKLRELLATHLPELRQPPVPG